MAKAKQRLGYTSTRFTTGTERAQSTQKPTGYVLEHSSSSSDNPETSISQLTNLGQPPPLRPTLPQQCVRAVLHMLQFGLAYFIMLLAMYYNGYIIICILLGALIGAFVFSWDLGESDAKGCCGESG